MLSPHEFSTLMLVRHSPDQIDMNRTELGTLLEHRLVALESRAGEQLRLSLTKAGRRLLEVMGRSDATLPLDPAGFDRWTAGL
jgi:hypothetical protein